MWFTGLSFFGRGGLGIRRAEKVKYLFLYHYVAGGELTRIIDYTACPLLT